MDYLLKPFEKLSQDRQESILDAAARIFARNGYYRANIAGICRGAGISNGALYNYFKNKEGLYTAVFTRATQLIESAFQVWVAREGGFFELLEKGLQDVIPFNRQYHDYLVVYLEHGHPSMDQFAPGLSDRIERVAFDFWVDFVKRGQAAGEINRDIDVSAAAYFLDNHIMLLAFSLISEHYNQRFHRYFGRPDVRLTGDEKIALTMRSFRQLLG